MDVLILGASARAAAFSALRAGLRPSCIDLFADRDVSSLCRGERIPAKDYPQRFAELAAAEESAPWFYTGALENHPDLVDQIARDRPLWGNAGATLRAVRDPIAVADTLQRAGLPCPKVELSPAGLPRDGTWLVKPLASAGGRGIRPLDRDATAVRRPSYFQERIAGPSLSAIFVGDRSQATLRGVTRQWVGIPGANYAYQGSLGPWPVLPAEWARLVNLGTVLAGAFGLVGLFGVDFILADGQPWPVEVNPRYTASIEVLELASGRSLLAEHRLVCERNVLEPNVFNNESEGRVAGKLIVFAPAPCTFPDIELRRDSRAHLGASGIADVPQPGTVFDTGEPVLTLLASGANLATCQSRLERGRSRWEQRLREFSGEDAAFHS